MYVFATYKRKPIIHLSLIKPQLSKRIVAVMIIVFSVCFQIKTRVQTLLNQQGGSVKDIRSVLRGNACQENIDHNMPDRKKFETSNN